MTFGRNYIFSIILFIELTKTQNVNERWMNFDIDKNSPNRRHLSVDFNWLLLLITHFRLWIKTMLERYETKTVGFNGRENGQ